MALDKRHNYDGKVQSIGTRTRDEAAIPLVRPGSHNQGAGQGTSGRAPEAGTKFTVVHLEAYKKMAVLAWMATEQRECIAV